MSEKRRTDKSARSWFRSRRFVLDNGKWYFNTREGTVEGPFGALIDAEARLEGYIKVANSGFMSMDGHLGLEPIDRN
jgi:Domain of unknown function (DUF6316)